MKYYTYRNSSLYCEEFPLVTIAREIGTPFYGYSYQSLVEQYRAIDRVFPAIPHLVC